MTATIRLGLLRLCDAAPVILARHEGLFATHGLEVALSVEPSWANIADKLGYGLLEGAVMLPPLAIACAAGLRGRQTGLVVPMSLSSNGNAVTLAAGLRGAFTQAGIAGVAAGRKPRLAVVHAFSTHDLLLRFWLAQSGLDPDRDVEITVLPPPEMPASLAAGRIDGFCAGAPWGQVASQAGAGFIAIFTRDIKPGHAEKCLAVREAFAREKPAALLALVAALREAGLRCASPEGRGALARLLGEPEYLDLPAELLAAALDPAAGGPVFTRQYPDPADAAWFAEQMLHWHHAPPGSLAAAAHLYRPDIFLAAGGTAS
jgi:NitT/TauT family transport system ATP-binding protein/nitrate/nitrite transport system substrate-binding protein